MELIGNILKESTRIGSPSAPSKVDPENTQKRTLYKLIKKARSTAFGEAHNFAQIMHDVDFTDRFKDIVPITNYERYHEKWLHRSINGEKNVTWTGKPHYFALSSGTTAGSSKKIPVSEKMIKKFQKATIQQLNGIYDLQLPPSFYKSNLLIVGGSTDLKKVNKSFNGDLSGILAKNKSFILSPFIKPSKRIAKIKNWDEKVAAIVADAPNWNIGAIAGVPSWVSQLLERIIDHYKLETIHDIWPDLKLYIHGGIFLKPYQDKFETLFGKSMVYQNTYLASEGYFAYQRDFLKSGMQLMLSNGVFFEFVEEKHFPLLDSDEHLPIPTLTIDQVKEWTTYAMVISTCAGLWRYSLGDTIEFCDVRSRTIRVTGRISFHLNTYGEHLSDSNLINTMELLSNQMNVSIEEFTVFSDKENKRHNWYIGANTLFDEAKGAAELDDILMQLNDDYETVRDHLLKSPKIRVLPTKSFYEFLHKCGKIGSQNKFPHVLTKEQNNLWQQHLEED
ncbi:MAG: GH3 auxin-responsive promoter family protein [Crocinitomicaceae bacterium]|nr:GH3 auxin-responsive promoter family protein [Crocinitomicaceae bacterium]